MSFRERSQRNVEGQVQKKQRVAIEENAFSTLLSRLLAEHVVDEHALSRGSPSSNRASGVGTDMARDLIPTLNLLEKVLQLHPSDLQEFSFLTKM